MKNSYIEELETILANADDKTLWATWIDMKTQLSKLKRIEKKIKNVLTDKVGDKEYIEFEDGAGVYWQHKTYKTVPAEKAARIVDDQDLFTQIVKVDMKKAEELLSQELYYELKKVEEVEKTSKSLMTGDIPKNAKIQ
jgi:hypothetical protein